MFEWCQQTSSRAHAKGGIFLFYIIASMHESCFITTFVIIQGKVVNTIDGENEGTKETGKREGKKER